MPILIFLYKTLAIITGIYILQVNSINISLIKVIFQCTYCYIFLLLGDICSKAAHTIFLYK